MNLPLYNKLNEYIRENRISFAMPGHKNGRGIPFFADACRYDVTELDGTLDLIHKSGDIVKAENLLSEFYGTHASRILTGGSTSGIFAMLLWALKPGDTLLANRTVHASVINAAAMYGFRVVLMPQKADPEFMIPSPVTAEAVAQGLGLYPEAKAVLVTSPSYYGECADIEAIAALTKAHGIPLLSDSAHGAAYAGCGLLPQPAHLLGAAMSCESAHKTLNAMNGAAYLHIMHSDISRVDEIISMVLSSSPSYPVAISADYARACLAEPDNGWDECVTMCLEFKKRVSRKTRVKILDNDDPTRMVLNFTEYGVSGHEAYRLLAAAGIDAEMSDRCNTVLIVTPSNTKADMEALEAAVYDICSGSCDKRCAPENATNADFFSVCEPQKAFYSKSELVPAGNAAGRISRRTVMAYPPGVPVIAMGERISKNSISVTGDMIEVCKEE